MTAVRILDVASLERLFVRYDGDDDSQAAAAANALLAAPGTS
jgi:hypothetical protein